MCVCECECECECELNRLKRNRPSDSFWTLISESVDRSRVDVLRQCVLNLFMLIFCVHTESSHQFTGNVTSSHNGKLPE